MAKTGMDLRLWREADGLLILRSDKHRRSEAHPEHVPWDVQGERPGSPER